MNVTPFEPEWEGYVTLEFSNTTPLPAKIYAGEGCAQVIFFESDEVCETSYRDRGGKYQGQQGVTLPQDVRAPPPSMSRLGQRAFPENLRARPGFALYFAHFSTPGSRPSLRARAAFAAGSTTGRGSS